MWSSLLGGTTSLLTSTRSSSRCFHGSSSLPWLQKEWSIPRLCWRKHCARWLEEDETIKHLETLRIEMDQRKLASNKSLTEVIDRDEAFCFRLCPYTIKNIMKAQVFGEQDEKINLMPRETGPPKAQTLLAFMTPILLFCKSESGESIAVYNSPRVLRQLEYDQWIVQISRNTFFSCATCRKKYLLVWRDTIFSLELKDFSSWGWGELGNVTWGSPILEELREGRGCVCGGQRRILTKDTRAHFNQCQGSFSIDLKED